MGFLSRLRQRDDKRTRAAELTLRESIYPLMLVTVLFFLWVRLLRPIEFTPTIHY
jgi:FHS family L-fucose permease-like MFS transporter